MVKLLAMVLVICTPFTTFAFQEGETLTESASNELKLILID